MEQIIEKLKFRRIRILLKRNKKESMKINFILLRLRYSQIIVSSLTYLFLLLFMIDFFYYFIFNYFCIFSNFKTRL